MGKSGFTDIIFFICNEKEVTGYIFILQFQIAWVQELFWLNSPKKGVRGRVSGLGTVRVVLENGIINVMWLNINLLISSREEQICIYVSVVPME